MFKKALTVFIVFLCVWAISISCFADGYAVTSDMSPYGANSSGLGVSMLGGVQYVRNSLTTSSNSPFSSISYIDYYDYQYRGGFSGSIYGYDYGTTEQSNYYLDFSGSNSGVDEVEYRIFFPASYIRDSYLSAVDFQYILGGYSNTSSAYSPPSSHFLVGNTYYANFSLYFSETTEISKLKLAVQTKTGGVKMLPSVIITDIKNGRGFEPSVTINGNIESEISFNLDEPVSNFLAFRIPFQITASRNLGYVKSQRDSDHASFIWFDKFVFSLTGVSFDSGEKSTIKNAGENAVSSGNDSISQSQADSANTSISNLVSSMGYSGTNAVLNIPSFTWGLGNIIPERTWFSGVNVDMGAYINQFVPTSILSLIRALCDIAVVFFCVKELYNLISTVLVNRKASDNSE